MWSFDRATGMLERDEELCGFGSAKRVPVGTFTIGAWFNDPAKGDTVAYLLAQPDTDTLGRECMIVAQPASDGHIVLARSLREQMRDSGDGELKVI